MESSPAASDHSRSNPGTPATPVASATPSNPSATLPNVSNAANTSTAPNTNQALSDAAVSEFLRQRGYTSALHAFQEEVKQRPESSEPVVIANDLGSDSDGGTGDKDGDDDQEGSSRDRQPGRRSKRIASNRAKKDAVKPATISAAQLVTKSTAVRKGSLPPGTQQSTSQTGQTSQQKGKTDASGVAPEQLEDFLKVLGALEKKLGDPSTTAAGKVSKPTLDALRASFSGTSVEFALVVDPTAKQEGFRQLEAWVDGSLDIYRVSVE